MKKIKLFFALFAMLALGVGNAWGANYEIVAKKGSGDGSSLSTSTKVTDVFSNGTYVAKFTTATKSYYNGSNGLKLGASSSAGDLKFTLTDEGKVKATTIIVSAKRYNTSKSVTLQVIAGGVTCTAQTISNSANFTDYTYTINANIADIQLKTSKYCWVESITINYEDGGSTETVLSVTPTEVDFGTVYQGATVEAKTVAVNFSNLTGAVTYNGLESTPFTATGSISATGDKITIAADASTIDEYSQTLTVVSAADNKTAEVTVTMKVVEAPAPTGTFELYSGELTEGDYVIYYNGSAMKAEVASSRLSYVEVAPTDNKIENPDAATIWHIAQSGTNWTIYNNDKGYAAGTGTANKAQLLSQEDITTSASASDNLKKASWTVTGTETYDFVNVFNSTKDSPVNATLRNNVNGGTNYGFACYATNTGGALTLYKKSDGKQPAGLVYETNKYRTKLGDSFATPTLTNPNSLNVTYSSSNNDVAEVATDGSVTIKAVGGVEITATFAGSETHRQGSAKYTICVTEHAGTQADPYSVADARRVIDVMETAEGVYATGIVSEIVTAYNSTYGNITYNISVDGTTTGNQLQAYRGKSYDGANFKSADDVKVGDEVVIKGTLKKYSTTYEFDENNQLVSLNRTKEQAGLAYAETEHTANVGEDFAEPALTNPNNLTVTYSSSNTTLATVNATTGEVTILAAGKVTITATTAGDATYAAGSASYNITITDPSLAIATLPFAFNGNKAAIETTAGMTQTGLGSDYSASSAPNSQLKFDHTGDWLVIHFDSEPDQLSYDIKNNSFSGGTFSVQESADGETYTDVKVHTEITETQNEEHTLLSTSRYVKFIYTEKSSGNVGLGNITISKADFRQETGLAWNPATVSLTVGDAFTAPTFSNPNTLTGITFASDNEALATVTNAGVISLVSGKTGIATITATYAGDATYKAAEVTCVITVSPKSEKVVILAEYNGQWYALKNAEQTAGKVIAALPVNYVGGKLYNVADADKATIEWQLAIDGSIATFKNGENYIFGTEGDTNLKLSTTECEWTLDGSTYKIGNRTFIYRAQANGFKNYNTTTTPGTDDYSNLPVVTAPVYATGDAYGRTVTNGEYGTICISYGSSNYKGAEFYEISWMEMDGAKPKGIWLDQVNGALKAGKPYIFKATADEIAIIGDGTTAAAPIAGEAGLTGTFTLIQDIETSDPSNKLEGNYMISGNQFLLCPAGCWLNANRAYIDATIIAGHTTKKAEIPGRRRVCLGETSENEATGFENIVAPEGQAVKAIVNGQLIIIRDGVKYNVQGQKL